MGEEGGGRNPEGVGEPGMCPEGVHGRNPVGAGVPGTRPEEVVPDGHSRHPGPGWKEEVVRLEVARVGVVRVGVERLGVVRVGVGGVGPVAFGLRVCALERGTSISTTHRLCHTKLNQGFIQAFKFRGGGGGGGGKAVTCASLKYEWVWGMPLPQFFFDIP